MLVVVALEVLLSDLGLRDKFRSIEDNVFKLALFRNRIDVSVLVAVVIGFQLGVGGMDGLEDVVFLQYGVIEFHFGVLLFELLADFGVGHHAAGTNQGAQLVNQNVFFDQLLELRDGVAVARNDIRIGFLANELATRKYLLPQIALMEKVA